MKSIKRINKKRFSPNFKLFGGILTAGFLMMGTASFAQETEAESQERENVTNTEVDEFNQYDANQDQQWDREEFDTRMEEDRTFETWDTDRNETLSEDEFNEGTRNQRNQETQQGVNEGQEGAINNQDETLNNQEEGINNQDGTTEGLYGQPEEGINNQDATQTTGTINTERIGTFSELDQNQDGVITRDEFNEGVYNTLDTNQDTTLDSDEFNEGINAPETGTDLNEGIEEENNNLNRGNDTETAPDVEQDTDTGTGTGY